MRRITAILTMFLLCLTGMSGCGASAAVGFTAPKLASSGSGQYVAAIGGQNSSGTFEFDGFTCTVTPDCKNCAAITFFYDGQQFQLTSCGCTVPQDVSAFPEKSFWRALPSLMQGVASGTLTLTRGTDGWQTDVYADCGVLQLTVDTNGNILRIGFPAANGEIQLKYGENTGACEPSGQ